MADHTKIEWTDSTWNIITGCSVVSPGCTNCYAMRLAGTRLQHHPSRIGLTDMSKAGPVWNGQVRFNEQWLDQPLRWRRPRQIFVCAHGDLFHEAVPDEWLDKVFAIMAESTWHTFQVLTKRPDRMLRYLSHESTPISICDEIDSEWRDGRRGEPIIDWPLPNVWLGVSVEDQQRADERIPLLLQTPAAVRWVSAEPLLGHVDLELAQCTCPWPEDAIRTRHLLQCPADRRPHRRWSLDWVVAGGESGPGARPMHPDWARSLRDQCLAAGVPFLFKQWGEYTPAPGPIGATKIIIGGNGHARSNGAESLYDDDYIMAKAGKKRAGRELDGRTWDQYPEVQA